MSVRIHKDLACVNVEQISPSTCWLFFWEHNHSAHAVFAAISPKDIVLDDIRLQMATPPPCKTETSTHQLKVPHIEAPSWGMVAMVPCLVHRCPYKCWTKADCSTSLALRSHQLFSVFSANFKQINVGSCWVCQNITGDPLESARNAWFEQETHGFGGQHCKSEAQDTAIVVNLQVWFAWRLLMVIQFKLSQRHFQIHHQQKWPGQSKSAGWMLLTSRFLAENLTRLAFHKSYVVWLQKPNSLCLTSQRDCATWHKYTLFENWNVA